MLLLLLLLAVAPRPAAATAEEAAGGAVTVVAWVKPEIADAGEDADPPGPRHNRSVFTVGGFALAAFLT